MLKLKTVFASLLVATVITMNSLPIMAENGKSKKSKDTDITIEQGYTLNWKSTEEGKVLEKATISNVDYRYEYNDNRNRILKKSKKDTAKFSYDNNSKLISELRGKNHFTYQYDYLNKLVGFTLNDTMYYYIKDSDFNVTAITDTDNHIIVKYDYDKNGIVSAIWGKDSVGNWIDKSNDNSFIGTLNLIRLHSYYYDEETGWYYNGLQYYNPVNNTYIVGGITQPSSIGNFTKSVSVSTIIAISQWKSELMNNNNTFGVPIDYSSGWYNSLSTVEILARLLYGENTVNGADQYACAWIVINRKNNGGFGGNTYRGVATYSGAFEPITGGEDGTENARTPDTSDPRWSSAVWAACTLLTTSSNSDYLELIAKPNGITDQFFFTGLTYFMLSYKSQNDYPTGLRYNMDGTFHDIEDVVIVFNTNDTYQNPTSKEAILNNSRLDTYYERSTHNIFFNLE